MCGIVGVLDARTSRPEPETEALLHTMADRMIARGPDASGVWADEAAGIGFGHRRLSIIDLSEHGAQPMHSADGRFVLTYNGEIYNHDELARRLDADGLRRRGHSDTEVLIESIARWGIADTLERIDGMFAFGLWDRERRELTLARDRLGEKPLYYGRMGSGEWLFGSSLDALRAHPAFDRPVDRDALALYFRHKYVPAPHTIFEGVAKLTPGCSVVLTGGAPAPRPTAYWSMYDVVARGVTFDGSDAEAVDHLDALLRRSVRQRMVADVPVGAFLSGGIDSSTIVAIAQQQSATPVRTFTIGSTDSDFDESSDARAVAEHLGTDHTELVVTGHDALAVVDSLGMMYDEPFGDSSQIPTRLVSELARREVVVALSGDAGDELFGGYNRYLWVPGIWRRLAPVPQPLRRGVAAALGHVAPSTWDRAAQLLPRRRRPQQLGLKVAKVLAVADAASPEDVFSRLVSHWPDPTALVPGSSEPPTAHTDAASWPHTRDIVEHMMAIDAVTYLPDDILTKVDRAAMSVSLETRIPLLDREIVEFAAGLPPAMKIRPGRSKWLLRQVLARSVPDELVDRPKSGFGLPIDDWLRGPLRSWAADHLHGAEVAGFLDTEIVAAAWDEHQSGRRNNAYDLWDVLMFSSWCRDRSISS